MAQQTCPGCRGELVPGEREGVRCCPDCRGRFVERRALRAMGLELPRSLGRKAPRRPRPCAGCGAGMDTIEVEAITLDWCEDCGALYFDAGELEALVAARPPPPTDFACDACGKRAPLAERRLREARLLCAACSAALGPAAEPDSELDREYRRALQHAQRHQLGEVSDDHSLLGHHRRRLLGHGRAESRLDTLLDVLLHLFR